MKKMKVVLTKLKNKIWMFIIPFCIMMMLGNNCWAVGNIGSVGKAGSIGTAEVTKATDNVKDAIIKLAMPIRRSASICKYCYYINKNDCKCE